MYIQTIDKKAGLKKSISCILIALIVTLGFPFSAFSTSNPESTSEQSSRIEKSPIQTDKKVDSIGTEHGSSFDGSNEHFAIIEEFKIDKGFWFSLFAISELARKNEGNKQTAFKFTPIGFSFTGSGFSPIYTQLNQGVNTFSINRDNLTGKLALPAGKSILIEGLNQTSGGASGNNEIRQGEWEENIKISVEEYTGIRNFEVPVSFKTEPVNKEKSLLRISFESNSSFIYSLKSNASISQKFKGFVIIGAENNKVYFSVFRYEGDCYQYENESKIDHFVGQQIGYLANPENGKALLNSGDVGDFDRLLAEYPTINPTSGNFSEKETTPPEWMEKILGMSRFLQVNAVAAAEKRTDFASIATGLGGHIIDGLWSMAFNTSSFLRDIASGGQTDAQISEVKNRLFDSKVSFIRNLYDPEKETKGLTGIGPKLEIVDPSIIECYSKIGWDSSGLAGNLLVVTNDKWEILKPTSLGKYPDVEEPVFNTMLNLEKVNQKFFWIKKSFARTSLFNNGYGKMYQSAQVKKEIVDENLPTTKTTTSVNTEPIITSIANDYGQPTDTSEKYINMQTLEYSGKGNQYRARSITATVLRKKINSEKKVVDYELWNMGQVMEPEMEENKTLYGPIEFSRELENEKVTFKKDGFSLIEQVLNHTIEQVKIDNPRKESWKDKINLDFVGEYLPRELEFNFYSREVELGNNPCLVIKYESAPFTFNSLENDILIVKARSIGVFVYSVEKDRIYQHTATFEAYCMDESLIIEEFGYLSDQNARPMNQILDVRNEFILKKEPLKMENPGQLPVWVIQSIMAKQIAFTSGIGAGERRTNPAAVISIISDIQPWGTFDEAFHALVEKLKSTKTLEEINKVYKKFYNWLDEYHRRQKENMIKNAVINFLLAKIIVPVALLINPLLGLAVKYYFEAKEIYEIYEIMKNMDMKSLKGIISSIMELKTQPKKILIAPSNINEIKSYQLPEPPKPNSLGTILIISGCGVVAGFVIKKLAVKGKSDITGPWTMYIEQNIYNFYLNDDGTIDWDIPNYNGWPIYNLTGTYQVNGDQITMKLTYRGDSTYPKRWDHRDTTYTGKINNSNSMSGNYITYVDIMWSLNYHQKETWTGSWSATR